MMRRHKIHVILDPLEQGTWLGELPAKRAVRFTTRSDADGLELVDAEAGGGFLRGVATHEFKFVVHE